MVQVGKTFELIMVICFGLSRPLSVYKSTKPHTAKGKNLSFKMFIRTGCVGAIIGKIVAQNLAYVFYFCILNIVMIPINICLYFRNYRLDALASQRT